MSLYSDSAYPVTDEIDTIHEAQLNRMFEPGTWGTGAQRLAVATAAREAAYEAGILEKPDDPGASPTVELPEVAKNFIAKLAVSPKDVLQDTYREAHEGGLSDEEYVEIVGVVSRMVNLDVFARGLGIPLRPLPESKTGEPSRERPEAAIPELAFVPTIPNPPEGGPAADELYGGHPKPYIVRGMSLVPQEVRDHIELEEVGYLPLRHILEPQFQQHDGLTRSQAEIVAGRVSALNECFF